jgi:RNA polymerase sigma factor (sigma-70 family)
MARVQAGDQEAYRTLLDDVAPVLLGFLRRRLGGADVEDAHQEALLALHRARATYDPARPFDPWLFAIARHVAADHARRWARVARREVLGDEPDGGSVEGEGPLKRGLEQALAQLPANQREAIQLLRLDGLSLEEAAVRAGTTTGALKVRMHRALKTLRRMLGA